MYSNATKVNEDAEVKAQSRPFPLLVGFFFPLPRAEL